MFCIQVDARGWCVSGAGLPAGMQWHDLHAIVCCVLGWLAPLAAQGTCFGFQGLHWVGCALWPLLVGVVTNQDWTIGWR
jgi:hypothetical protein